MVRVCFAYTAHEIQNNNMCALPLSCYFADSKSGNTSLDILLALLQAEGAKIEEETEVSIILLPPWMTSCVPHFHQAVIHIPAFPVVDVLSYIGVTV